MSGRLVHIPKEKIRDRDLINDAVKACRAAGKLGEDEAFHWHTAADGAKDLYRGEPVEHPAEMTIDPYLGIYGMAPFVAAHAILDDLDDWGFDDAPAGLIKTRHDPALDTSGLDWRGRFADGSSSPALVDAEKAVNSAWQATLEWWAREMARDSGTRV